MSKTYDQSKPELYYPSHEHSQIGGNLFCILLIYYSEIALESDIDGAIPKFANIYLLYLRKALPPLRAIVTALAFGNSTSRSP